MRVGVFCMQTSRATRSMGVLGLCRGIGPRRPKTATFLTLNLGRTCMLSSVSRRDVQASQTSCVACISNSTIPHVPVGQNIPKGSQVSRPRVHISIVPAASSHPPHGLMLQPRASPELFSGQVVWAIS